MCVSSYQPEVNATNNDPKEIPVLFTVQISYGSKLFMNCNRSAGEDGCPVVIQKYLYLSGKVSSQATG